MTPEQMMILGTAFVAYLRMFEDCIAYRPTAQHLHSYCRGLLSDLARKSIEPMALACGTAVRTLQEFLRDHVWDHFRMRDQLQQRLARQPALAAADELGTIGVIDGGNLGDSSRIFLKYLTLLRNGPVGRFRGRCYRHWRGRPWSSTTLAAPDRSPSRSRPPPQFMRRYLTDKGARI